MFDAQELVPFGVAAAETETGKVDENASKGELITCGVFTVAAVDVVAAFTAIEERVLLIAENDVIALAADDTFYAGEQVHCRIEPLDNRSTLFGQQKVIGQEPHFVEVAHLIGKEGVELPDSLRCNRIFLDDNVVTGIIRATVAYLVCVPDFICAEGDQVVRCSGWS